MKRALFLIFILAILLDQSLWAADTRPVVLLFDTTNGKGVDKSLAASATKALRDYLRETKRVEVTIFDRESPTVLRAIMEKRLSPDKIASYSSIAERIEVAKILAFEYTAGAEVSMKESAVEVKLWFAKVNGTKQERWETTGSASSIGAEERDLENAMHSAASSAVRFVEEKALSALPRISEQLPITDGESTALNDATSTAPNTNNTLTADDYAARGESCFKDGDLAQAIDNYSKAINVDPVNAGLRLRLAILYTHKGMFGEANDELKRAAEMGVDAALITQTRNEIDKIKNNPIVVSSRKAVTTEPVRKTTQVKGLASQKAAISKIVEGDKSWSNGEPDEAAKFYKEAIVADPLEWRAYERLAQVNAWMSLFNESRKVLEELNKLQPKPPADVIAKRYEVFRIAIDNSLKSMIKLYESDKESFEQKKLSRESYYDSAKGIFLKLESMSKLLDALEVPATKKSANLRRSLACGLLSQAASSLMDYLETNNVTYKQNTSVFVTQAKNELDTASKLDGSSVTLDKNERNDSSLTTQ